VIICVSQCCWPAILAVIIALICEAILTGGFHEDAVADCCDAFGGGWSREDVLRIMKDSRIGSFGALGLVLALLLRVLGLSMLPLDRVIVGAMASAAIGRWAILLMMLVLPPIPNRDGLSKDVGQQIGRFQFIAGTILTIPVVLFTGFFQPWGAIVAIFAVVIFVFAWSAYVKWRIGGLTGDCLGTVCYVSQCLVLLALTTKIT
jgi:adenosylcobinamide-GDP ribazoletransferase